MTSDNVLVNAIQQATEASVKLIVEEEAKAAAARVVERVRGMAAEIVTKVFNHTSFEQFDRQLTIRIDLNGLPEKL